MHILLLGATGRVGSHVLAQALQEGHQVTALVRSPEKIRSHHENLTIVQGNVLTQEDLLRGIHGTEVVISALNTDGTSTLSDSTPLLIDAMYSEGVQRIITVGTAGILQSRTSKPNCAINPVNPDAVQLAPPRSMNGYSRCFSNLRWNGPLYVLRICRMESG